MLNNYDLRKQAVETLFTLASPPRDLPTSLNFKSTEKNPIDLDAIIEEYAPYYKYKKETKITTKYDKSGEAQEEKVETLKMTLIDPEPYRKLLRKYTKKLI